MKLIKINLNQTVSKAQINFMNKEKKRWYVFGLISALFLCNLIWLLSINSKMSKIIEQRTDTINSIVLKTNNLKNKNKNKKKGDSNEVYVKGVWHPGNTNKSPNDKDYSWHFHTPAGRKVISELNDSFYMD